MKTQSYSQKRFDDLLSRLRARKHRITPQRIALLRLLSESTEHPSASAIFADIKKRYPSTSLATVYKTLSVLKEMGEVMELGFGEGDNRYDGKRPFPHPHLVCLRCRRIVDLDIGSMKNLEREAARGSGFKILGHRLDFYGVCPECRSRAGS